MLPVVVVVNKLLADISKVSVELKEKSKARHLFFLAQNSQITASTSVGMSLLACIRASAESRSVFIVERKCIVCIVLKDRSGVAVDTGIVDGNNCEDVGIKVQISVLEAVSVSVTGFSSVE